MIVILPCLPDPTDVVLQGEVIGDASAMDWQLALAKAVPISDIPALIPLVAGQAIGDKVLGDAVPRAMIGQHDWYGIRPRTVGPMRQAGGRIEMVTIGQSFRPKPEEVFIDPTQAWQAQAYDFDKTGMYLTLYEPNTIGAPEPIAQFQLAQPLFPEDPVVAVPRGAVYRSGLAKRTTMPTLLADFGGHGMEGFVETTQRWFVTGVTRDGAGAPLASCTVVLMKASKIVFSPDILANPIEAIQVSDGSGNYSFQVPDGNLRQLMAYLAGSPDKAGVTVNTVAPTLV